MATVTFPTPSFPIHPVYLGVDFCQQAGSVSALFSFIFFSIITVIPLLSSHYFHLFLFPVLYFVVWPPLFWMGLVNLEDQRPSYPVTFFLPPIATLQQKSPQWFWKYKATDERVDLVPNGIIKWRTPPTEGEVCISYWLSSLEALVTGVILMVLRVLCDASVCLPAATAINRQMSFP